MKICEQISAIEFFQPEALPQGMDVPYYIKRIERFGKEGVDITLRNGCKFIICGGQNCTYTVREDRSLEHGSMKARIDCIPYKVWCEQTGGMCMVDVVQFINGYHITINDEVVVVWESKEHFLKGFFEQEPAFIEPLISLSFV